MFKGSYISLFFILCCLAGCTSIELPEVNQKVGYAYITMIMPGQICSKKSRGKVLLRHEIAHKNAKICYYG